MFVTLHVQVNYTGKVLLLSRIQPHEYSLRFIILCDTGITKFFKVACNQPIISVVVLTFMGRMYYRGLTEKTHAIMVMLGCRVPFLHVAGVLVLRGHNYKIVTYGYTYRSYEVLFTYLVDYTSITVCISCKCKLQQSTVVTVCMTFVYVNSCSISTFPVRCVMLYTIHQIIV